MALGTRMVVLVPSLRISSHCLDIVGNQDSKQAPDWQFPVWVQYHEVFLITSPSERISSYQYGFVLRSRK